MNQRPRLALTLGDPAGIGPEIVLKALANLKHSQVSAKITVVGDSRQVRLAYSRLRPFSEELADPDSFEILDTKTNLEISWGHGNAASGEASFVYLDTAIARTLAGEFDAIVTSPIAKSAWKLAGHDFPGQTELLAQRCDESQFGMLFVGKSPYSGWLLRTLLATVHIPLADVPKVLTPELVERKLDLLWRSLQDDFNLSAARVAVAGLNPHSGEQGQLGREERDWLVPLLQDWQAKHPNVRVDGPIPPDTMWINPGLAWHDPAQANLGHDAYLAMYHDQGLIPVKLLAFEQAVNTTIGLPFVRTSPDRGTAFDIAGRGIASSASLEAAIALAAELTTTKWQHDRKSGTNS
ncbi:4-hydroxythreonine-4-phosphate dehydrogenase PdxA [Pseudanabaena sp. PCC 6802]|uniref:4-hydroxythreonine-4-phosphate dehydrogenase PdxA n=1 Tax=Pseudanabaena sp. PCC 6802 TaxID=118173 RepID=UPI00037CEEBB|nr:4-hydroxythreonine-4-phosphate dehydrogenase PdxA [Pseudanabaena sp. PCC 6802]